MKVLVTGGRGFLGQKLVSRLIERGFETVSLSSKDCDLSLPDSIQFLDRIAPDFIFHLAGKTGVFSSWQSPKEYYQANFDTTRNVLEYCRVKKTPMHYVSGYVYGNLGDQPISEKMPPRPNHPYAHSKWLAEEICLFYHKFFLVPLTISRPFNIYGPKQNLSFFIPRIIDQLFNQPQVKTRGLDSKRDYVFIEDVVDALMAIMERGKTGNCYNIASGVGYSCFEVIERLMALTQIRKPLLREESSPDDVRIALADIEKIQSELNWRPKYSLEQGIKKCL